MFDRAQLIDALLHEDFYVRSRVLDRFAADSDTDPAIARQYMKAVERYGWAGAYEWAHRASQLIYDEETFAWLVERILDESEHRPDDRQCRHLLVAFSKGPVALIGRYLDQVSSVSLSPSPFAAVQELADQGAEGSTLDLAAFRIELEEHSMDDCRALLENLFAICAAGDHFPTQQIERMEYVSERLAKHGGLVPSQVADWLAVDFNSAMPRAHWRGGHALYQSGLLGLEETVPRMFELFEYDWDWLNEGIPEALIAMGTESVLDAVITYYPGGTWTERLYLGDVLEKLRFPGKEQELLRLLDSEEDDDLRKDIAVALVRYATPGALEKALEIYLEDPEDANRFEIAEDLYPLMTLSGEKELLLAEWRERMDSLRALSGAMDEHLVAKVPQKAVSDNGNSILPFETPTGVGRNDLCPCGSGKKYKQCCLT